MRKQFIYSVMAGRCGEYQGIGTIWASSVQDAKDQLASLPEDNKFSVAIARAEKITIQRALSNISFRLIDDDGAIEKEQIFGRSPNIN